jgi:hypothetical protein
VLCRYTEGFVVVGILMLYDADVLQAVVMPSFDCSISKTYLGRFTLGS